MMRLTLEAAGYDVAEAATGEEALAKYGDGHGYGAVLLDQKMPGLDGLHTLEQLKERVPDACVVMVTAFASIELAVDAMKLGASDFIRKPMTPETLRGSVAAALANRLGSMRPPTAPARPDGRPPIETLTLNGFRILRAAARTETTADHAFLVTQSSHHIESTVTVTISPDAVTRVTRLTGRALQPAGAFWRDQAERRLSAFLWTEGKLPASGHLTVDDVSRDDIDLAVAWTFD